MAKFFKNTGVHSQPRVTQRTLTLAQLLLLLETEEAFLCFMDIVDIVPDLLLYPASKSTKSL